MKTWLEHMETLGRDDRTLDRYRELLELYALPTVGGMQLKTLQPPHLSDLYAKLLREGRRDGKAGGLHPRTVGHVHRALHRMLKQGARWQLIARSPAADLELPSVPKSEMVTLTREQAGRLLRRRSRARSCVTWSCSEWRPARDSASYSRSAGPTLTSRRARCGLAGQWLYVGSTRAIVRTHYYSVISPEPAIRQDREREQVDVPAADRTPNSRPSRWPRWHGATAESSWPPTPRRGWTCEA